MVVAQLQAELQGAHQAGARAAAERDALAAQLAAARAEVGGARRRLRSTRRRLDAPPVDCERAAAAWVLGRPVAPCNCNTLIGPSLTGRPWMRSSRRRATRPMQTRCVPRSRRSAAAPQRQRRQRRRRARRRRRGCLACCRWGPSRGGPRARGCRLQAKCACIACLHRSARLPRLHALHSPTQEAEGRADAAAARHAAEAAALVNELADQRRRGDAVAAEVRAAHRRRRALAWRSACALAFSASLALWSAMSAVSVRCLSPRLPAGG